LNIFIDLKFEKITTDFCCMPNDADNFNIKIKKKIKLIIINNKLVMFK